MQTYKCTVNAVFVFLITVLFSFRTAAALKRENDSQTNGSYCCELFLNRCSRSDVWAEILLRTCHISLSLYNKRNFSHCSSSSLQFFLSFISCFVYLTCVPSILCLTHLCLNGKSCSNLQVYYQLVFCQGSPGPRVGVLFRHGFCH